MAEHPYLDPAGTAWIRAAGVILLAFGVGLSVPTLLIVRHLVEALLKGAPVPRFEQV